jgi:hypothetical protein
VFCKLYSALDQKAKEKLVEVFATHGHNPTSDQFTAVFAIQEALTHMLSGNAPQKYSVSSLDPGIGKTTSILTWLDAYLEGPEQYGNHGVIIALDRLEEIQRWINDGGIPEDHFAVLVSDCTEEGVELNNTGLGRHRRNEALILYTTKRQIRNRSMMASFNGIGSFHFRGQPRRIRIWDESFTIGEEVILNPCDFGSILSQLDSIAPELVDTVLGMVEEMRAYETSGTYLMPKLPHLPERVTAWDTLKEKNVATHLWRMSGQPVTIHSHMKGKVIVDSGPKLPDDFAPCLVLDASARLKATYEIQQEDRQDIYHLPYSNKSYRNLDVMVWERKSGKQIIKDIKDIVPELAALLTKHDGEKFLIILYKDHKLPCKRALSKELSGDQIAKVKFCTWGRHTATNQFSDIPNIIMLSPYQLPDFAYEATTRAATGLTTAKGKPCQDRVARVKRGEISSNILQAVNRGRVRKSEGDTCPPCRLWIITHPKAGIASELPNIFPECVIKRWKVLSVDLTSSKQRKTFGHLQDLFKQGVTEVLAKTVREYLGLKGSASNFTRDVLSQPIFAEAIASIGWVCSTDGLSYVFRRLTPFQAEQ